jgi:hypothetical protein
MQGCRASLLVENLNYQLDVISLQATSVLSDFTRNVL